MTSANFSLNSNIVELAARHGLHVMQNLTINEQGLDFRVVFVTDESVRRWVLRIPRRNDVQPKIEHEAKVLELVKRHIPVQVPDWQVCSPELVAYPLLTDNTALTFDAETYAVTWNIDQHSDAYIESLAEVLVALHILPIPEAVAAGIPYSSPEEIRKKTLEDLERVKVEIGVSKDLEAKCRDWINDDTLWPNFSAFVHGDLYAGHVTTGVNSRVSGVIDWTEAEVSDPSIDFSGHLAAFSFESLEKLVAYYAQAGGRTWPKMLEQIKARHTAAPIKYGLFAIISQSQDHLSAAKVQLGVS